MKHAYPDLREKRDSIAGIIKSEEAAFEERFNEFFPLFEREINRIKESSQKRLNAEFVFYGYDTCGIPVDLQKELAQEHSVEIDEEGLTCLIEGQRKRSRMASNISDAIFTDDGLFSKEEKERFSQLSIEEINESEQGYTLVFFGGAQEADNVDIDAMHAYAVVSPRPKQFYAESGGQIGDTGILRSQTAEAKIIDTFCYENKIVFQLSLKKGMRFQEGEEVSVSLDRERKEYIAHNHSATHLLHYALKSVLGVHANQSGSLVTDTRLRFDFTHTKKLSDSQIEKIEDNVNQCISDNVEIERKIDVDITAAKQMGATALFGEKYADKVTVVDIGGFSKELCGGTHAKKTGDIGLFKIVSESSIASGIRRIEAVTGKYVADWLKEEKSKKRLEWEKMRECLAKITPPEDSDQIKAFLQSEYRLVESCFDFTPEKANLTYTQIKRWKKEESRCIKESRERLQKKIKELEKKSNQKTSGVLQEKADLLYASGVRKDAFLLVADCVYDHAVNDLRKIKDFIKEQAKEPTVLCLFSGAVSGKSHIIIWLSPEVVEKGFNAGNIIRVICSAYNGSGGGRPDMAQGGISFTKDPAQMREDLVHILEKELDT